MRRFKPAVGVALVLEVEPTGHVDSGSFAVHVASAELQVRLDVDGGIDIELGAEPEVELAVVEVGVVAPFVVAFIPGVFGQPQLELQAEVGGDLGLGNRVVYFAGQVEFQPAFVIMVAIPGIVMLEAPVKSGFRTERKARSLLDVHGELGAEVERKLVVARRGEAFMLYFVGADREVNVEKSAYHRGYLETTTESHVSHAVAAVEAVPAVLLAPELVAEAHDRKFKYVNDRDSGPGRKTGLRPGVVPVVVKPNFGRSAQCGADGEVVPCGERSAYGERHD